MLPVERHNLTYQGYCRGWFFNFRKVHFSDRLCFGALIVHVKNWNRSCQAVELVISSENAMQLESARLHIKRICEHENFKNVG